jgi:pentatricopeptide repeat protein
MTGDMPRAPFKASNSRLGVGKLPLGHSCCDFITMKGVSMDASQSSLIQQSLAKPAALRIGQRLCIQSNQESLRKPNQANRSAGTFRPQKSTDVDEEKQQMLDIIYQRAWMKGSKTIGSVMSSPTVRRRRREAELASPDSQDPQTSPSEVASTSSRFAYPQRSARGALLPGPVQSLKKAATSSGWIDERLKTSTKVPQEKGAKSPPATKFQEDKSYPSTKTTFSTAVWQGPWQGPSRNSSEEAANHYTYGVRDILNALSAQGGHPTLPEVLRRSSTVASNCAIIALGTAKKHEQVLMVADAMLAEDRANEHTHGAIISALDSAGRFDLAISHFEGLLKKGVDVGPVCASVVIKLCARRRDIGLALDIYHRLSGQSTLNRFSYNCLIHLCGVLGRMDDAISILRMMLRDGGRDSKPDSYTYGALLKAVSNSKEYEWVPKLFREIQRSEVQIDEDVWSTLITLAGRADRPDLASTYYQAYRRSMDDGTTSLNSNIPRHIHNCLLTAHARHAPLADMLGMYRKMVAEGMQPDTYTFNALFKSAAQSSSPLHEIEDLVGETLKRNPQVKLNTILGTTLINAYKRSHEALRGSRESSGMASELILERVYKVLDELEGQRMANCQTYGAVMVIHSHLGDPHSVKKLLERMEEQGVTVDAMTYENVAKGFQNAGLGSLADQLLKKAKVIEATAPTSARERVRAPYQRHKKVAKRANGRTSLSFEDLE